MVYRQMCQLWSSVISEIARFVGRKVVQTDVALLTYYPRTGLDWYKQQDNTRVRNVNVGQDCPTYQIMHRTRQMLVATVLTTALITGAAKGAQAASASKPQTVSVARRLAAKLTTSFRQVLPAARLAPLRVTTDTTTTVVAIVPAASVPLP